MRHRRSAVWDRIALQVLAIIAILIFGAATLSLVAALSAVVFYGLAELVLSV